VVDSLKDRKETKIAKKKIWNRTTETRRHGDTEARPDAESASVPPCLSG